MIVIIDYDTGNVASIRNMLWRLQFDAVVSRDPELLDRASHMILPGVGAFDHGVRRLHELGLWDRLRACAADGSVPLLGICLGAQLLTRGSDEGRLSGLSLLPARTVKFAHSASEPGTTSIHMGWGDVSPVRDSVPLFAEFESTPRFYFVHGYHFRADDPRTVLATACHGYEFPCAIARDNIVGVQFHPEKSHRFGMQLLRNFVTRYAHVPRVVGDPEPR